MKSFIDYEPVIGLEVHAQLQTVTKLFCGCRAEFGISANSLTCPVCLGHPGALPVLNREAVDFAIRLILAVGGQVNRRSEFARKNYFYPDLPKGYQISQFDHPIGSGGAVSADTGDHSSVINLIRIHLEEDAGKSIHPDVDREHTWIDLNRCGIPLLEIVSQPEIRSPYEARAYLTKLKRILQYLGICSGDMEKGALRCDANVSVRPKKQKQFATRTELKNMNSFRAVERALAFEIERQIASLESGRKVRRETRLWNEKREETEIMRGKEGSEDYRYFQDPDLPVIIIEKKWIDDVKAGLPELPDAKRDRIVKEYGLPIYDAAVLTESSALADYFEGVAAGVGDKKLASNWIMVEVMGILNERKIEIVDFNVNPEMLTELLQRIETGVISGKMAKGIFEEMVDSGKRAAIIIEEEGLKQITDENELAAIIEKVLNSEKAQVEKYRKGKSKLFGFFVGQVMRETKGRGNPELVNKILKEKLDGG